MSNIFRNIIYYIASIFMGAMFFSCTNNVKEVRDLLKDKNRPIGEARDVSHIYKDSGRITSRLKTPLLYDYGNRKELPFSEFPEGLKITSIGKKDSTTISGDYAITYKKSRISEIKGNVIIINHIQHTKLETNQLFWDQKKKYLFTEEGFRLTTLKDTIKGFGFESKENLTKWVAKDITGDIQINQKEL